MTPFEIVLVPFPFTDLGSTKKRPCVVLATFECGRLGVHAVVCMVTSQVDGIAFPYDYRITDVGTAGLPKPSLVRVAKLVTIDDRIVIKKLGHLADRDRKGVRRQVHSLFEPILKQAKRSVSSHAR